MPHVSSYRFPDLPVPEKQGLYDPQFEHSACGVGMVANIDGTQSHEIIRQGLEVLINLGHRGAAGADPETGDGVQILFGDGFPTASGRGRFVPCPYLPADELPDAEYPFILNTGRVLEHWHTGSMTRRSKALDAIQPEAFVAVHPDDLQKVGAREGQRLRVTSRRGAIELTARSDTGLQPGSIFIPFHFREAAANTLTNDALDPDGKIPEYKVCAVKITPAT